MLALGVLGAGSWGLALANTLANKHPEHQILVWTHQASQALSLNQIKSSNYLPGVSLAKNLVFSADLALVLNQVEDLLLAVPSSAFLELIDKITQLVPNKTKRLLWACKGFDNQSLGLFHAILKQKYAWPLPLAVLSGPSFALEVALGKLTAVNIACQDLEFKMALDFYFNQTGFRIFFNDDFIGVQLAGIFKNILALAAGISDGLELGANARAAILSLGMQEFKSLSLGLGGKLETCLDLAGFGDIILSACDNKSRNRRLGLVLAQGLNLDQAKAEIGQELEVLNNLAAIERLAATKGLKLKICSSLNAILANKLKVADFKFVL